ncbi:MAG: MFS transporter [Lentilactobacillus hilgardii]|uniref:MFS transporter n=1 Tax=Lentilactobacillus hilgardii TaxID=1588 RepID=UPI001CC20DB6|nr:MFS transporter [Lentilactobacillus hilgardii]MBZ2199812.1 MFS transporter [Lentilactobacillus hilgardii]MBZ2203694.1 MFS transporter [Lentilactobacillus hilgardii]
MKTNYPTNINTGYAYTFFSFFGITGLWVIYLQIQGLSLVEIGLCESIFHVASFLFEVPTGVLADRFSYKSVLIGGRIASILSAIIMLTSHTFLMFAFSFVLSALSYNLQSGTIDALMYDSLIETRQTKAYPKIISTVNVLYEFGDTAGVVIAGFFVHWHFELTYVISILIGFFALISTLMMKEPNVTPSKVSAQVPETIGSILRTSYRVLKTNRVLRNLMFFQAVFAGICTSYYFYFQSLMEKAHFSGWMISLLMVTSAVVNIVGIHFTPIIQKRFPKAVLVNSLSWCLIALLLVSWLDWIPMLMMLFLASQLLSSLVEPIFSSYYNEMIDSKQRATLLSIASVLFSFAMIGLFPLVGWLIEHYNFSFAFGTIGGIILILYITTRIKSRTVLK